MAHVYETVVMLAPDAPALRFSSQEVVTHGELNETANRFARKLLSEGVRRGDVVGILSHKTLGAYACMLACLKIGAIYTVFDDHMVIERFRKKLERARCRVLFTDRPWTADVELACIQFGVKTMVMQPEVLRWELAQHPDRNLVETDKVTGADPAYIMFTSGSTGTPKGAVVSHQNLMNFRAWAADRFDVSPDDVFTGVNPMYFDNSVFDLYASVFNGASLAPFSAELVGDATAVDANALVDAVDEVGCTVWFSVPSLLIQLMTLKALRPESMMRIRRFVFGGEGFAKSELRKLYDLYGHRARLVNVYGPTECTCICSAFDVRAQDLEGPGLPPLGEMADNFDYVLMGEDGRPVPLGEAGELGLLGPQVGLGYYRDFDQTLQAFVGDPRDPGFASRMYRTGDLVRLDPQDGLLYFVGRRDNQIKHMGHRIELEEIEAGLVALPYVHEAVAIYERTDARFGRIVAVVGATAVAFDERIKQDLQDILPAYMIPSRVTVLSELPKNRNGKVDRQAVTAQGVA